MLESPTIRPAPVFGLLTAGWIYVFGQASLPLPAETAH
jgi:hypothetical protein